MTLQPRPSQRPHVQTIKAPLLAPPDSGDRRVNVRLPSLSHELLYYQLVERTAPGVWVLRPAMQAWLEIQVNATAPEKPHVFVGLRCEACGSRTVTSVVGERRLCKICADPSTGAADPAPLVEPASPRGRWRRTPHHLGRAG